MALPLCMAMPRHRVGGHTLSFVVGCVCFDDLWGYAGRASDAKDSSPQIVKLLKTCLRFRCDPNDHRSQHIGQSMIITTVLHCRAFWALCVDTQLVFITE